MGNKKLWKIKTILILCKSFTTDVTIFEIHTNFEYRLIYNYLLFTMHIKKLLGIRSLGYLKIYKKMYRILKL